MRLASQTIALEPLDESQMLALSAELLGEDRSVTELAELVAERAAGNPFFAEEIVRDLSERDVLVGGRGCYLCVDPAADVDVPRTLQAVIAARIDRLDPAAKRTLNAAAVIGSRFTPDMLQALEDRRRPWAISSRRSSSTRRHSTRSPNTRFGIR